MDTAHWWVLGTGITAIFALVSLGFTAMSTNPPYKVPYWFPKILFALAIVVISGEGFYFWGKTIFAPFIAVLGAIGLVVYLFWPLLKNVKQKPTTISESEKNVAMNVKAFYSGTKTETISGITRASHFIVNVKLSLHTNKPNIHLAWIRLYIGGQLIDPIQSMPQIKDSINYSKESYELVFEVPVNTFLKARYSEGSIRPDRDEPEAKICIKANNQDWCSEPFSIPYNKLGNLTLCLS